MLQIFNHNFEVRTSAMPKLLEYTTIRKLQFIKAHLSKQLSSHHYNEGEVQSHQFHLVQQSAAMMKNYV